MLSNADTRSADALLLTPQCAGARYPLASVSLDTVLSIAAVLLARRRGVRWPHAPAAYTRPPISSPPGSPLMGWSGRLPRYRSAIVVEVLLKETSRLWFGPS